jgi:hypothetical protein
MALNKTERQREYRTTKRGHLASMLGNAKTRAKNQKVDFDLDLNFLESIAINECPVFKTPFVWGQSQGAHPYRPSLDRIIPELGYVRHNVIFISLKANTIKQEVTEKELYAVADWLHYARKKVLNAQENTTSPVPEGDYREGEIYPELGPFSATGTWEDHYDLDHYQRTVRGQDADYRTQTRGGDSVGCRSKEVGAPATIESEQDNWQLHPTYGWIER